MIKLQEAIIFATEAHTGQLRKGSDDPYIVHPLRVMFAVADRIPRDFPDREDLLCAAVLHDVVEDTYVELPEIGQAFGRGVQAIVGALTRGSETHAEYVERVRASGWAAILIKLCDIADNLREPFPFGESMRKRYEWAQTRLLDGYAMF